MSDTHTHTPRLNICWGCRRSRFIWKRACVRLFSHSNTRLKMPFLQSAGSHVLPSKVAPIKHPAATFKCIQIHFSSAPVIYFPKSTGATWRPPLFGKTKQPTVTTTTTTQKSEELKYLQIWTNLQLATLQGNCWWCVRANAKAGLTPMATLLTLSKVTKVSQRESNSQLQNSMTTRWRLARHGPVILKCLGIKPNTFIPLNTVHFLWTS